LLFICANKHCNWNGKSFDAVVKELADKKYTKTPAKSYKKFEFKPVVESVIKAKFVNDEIELITNETSYFITESEANQLAYAFNSKKPTSIIIDDVQWIVSNRLNESVLKQKDSDVKLKLSQTIIDFIKNV
jgi:S-adenosylmethionine synthetase